MDFNHAGPPRPPTMPSPTESQASSSDSGSQVDTMEISAQQQVMSTESTQVPDMNGDECKKELTTYKAYYMLPSEPQKPRNENETWKKVHIIPEPLLADDIAKEVKRLDESKLSMVTEGLINSTLLPSQQAQITNHLQDMAIGEDDARYEFSPAQLDKKEVVNKEGLKEIEAIRMFVKRSPAKGVDLVALYQAIETDKANREKRVLSMNPRVPPPPPLLGAIRINQHRPPFPPPPFISSTRISDIAPLVTLTKGYCRKALTT